MIVHFMCQLDWAMEGGADIWLDAILNVCVKEGILDKINM